MAWVVAFHLWQEAVPGGWLGVGLFFTLSGYLIVGMLDSELRSTGSIDLARFFARRVRRLLPAGLVAITFGLVLSAILDEQNLSQHGVDAATAVLNVFNWHWAATNNDPGGPIDHFWSLAIEEQFYLVVPAAIALTRKPVAVCAAMTAICVSGVALWWESRDAYVATPVRATEIAVGAALAIAAARFRTVRHFGQAATAANRAAVVASIASVMVAVFVSSLLVASWPISLTSDAVVLK